MAAFWEGVVAGYGIAIPIGAIAVLIFETTLRKGFLTGFMAGAGAATADTIFALIASFAGVAVASALMPFAAVIRLTSVLVLFSIGLYGLWRTFKRRSRATRQHLRDNSRGKRATFWQFLGLTLLNPLTVVYFAALIMSREANSTLTTVEQLAFVAGAGLASLSWQTLLVCVGHFASQLLSERLQMIVSITGYLVVVGLGMRVLLSRPA